MFSSETSEFRMSETYIDQRRKMFKAMGIVFLLPMLGLAAVIIFFNIRGIGLSLKYGVSLGWFDLLFFTLPIALPIVLLFFARKSAKRIFSRLNEQRVRLGEDSLERSNGVQVETIYYNDIKEIRVHRDCSGELTQLSLVTDANEYTFVGLENMNNLLWYLQDQLFKVQMSERQTHWGATGRHFILYLVALIGIGLALGLFIHMQFSPLIANILQACLAIVPAIFFLMKRPISDGIANPKIQRRGHVVNLLLSMAIILIWIVLF